MIDYKFLTDKKFEKITTFLIIHSLKCCEVDLIIVVEKEYEIKEILYK